MSINTKPRLEGKVSFVTGAGMHDDIGGTCMATAVSLAREGAKVLVADISEKNEVLYNFLIRILTSEML